MYQFETIYNSYKIINNILNILYIYNIHIYVIICNNNINYTILYNKKKKNEIYIYIYILLYSICIIKYLFNYNTEDIQISMIENRYIL